MHPVSILRLAAGMLLAALPGAALPCSTCKAGDYTITLMGAEKPFAGRLRVAVDHLERAESQGAGLAERRTEESRTLLGLAYSFGPSLTVALQAPFVRKHIRDPATLAEQEAEGLGDLDLGARLVLFRDREYPRHLAGTRLGVRLPTAATVRDAQGRPLDIDVQPDAGALAPNLGAWYGYYRYPVFAAASATHFFFGDGRQGFEPGDATLVSVLLQRALDPALALQLGLDARHAGRNAFSGVPDPDSGGTLAMAWLGLAVRLFSDELLLNLGVQEPVLEDLHGEQDEERAWRAGITFDFAGHE